MISKPTEQDFKESTAVTVLREAKRTVVETGDGAASGFQNVVKFWLKGLFWFNILAVTLTAMVRGQVVTALIFIFSMWFLYKMFCVFVRHGQRNPQSDQKPLHLIQRDALFAEASHQSSIEFTPRSNARTSDNIKLSFPMAMRQSVVLGIPGLIMTFAGMGFVLMLIPGLALVGTAALIVFKALADREIVDFNERSITVNSLLSKKTLNWAYVTGIGARAVPWWNLKILVATGSRRTLVVSGYDSNSAIAELLIPIDLLDDGEEGLTLLIADLSHCHANAKRDASAPPRPSHNPLTSTANHRASFDPAAILASREADVRHIVDGATAASGSGMAPIAHVNSYGFGKKGIQK